MMRPNRSAFWWALALMLALSACGDDGGDDNGTPDPAPGMDPNPEADPNPDMMPDAEPDDRVRETIFPITYVARNRSEIPGIERGGNLYMIPSDGSADAVQINPEGIECDFGCVISDDLAWFLWLDNDGTNTALKAAPITTLTEDEAVVDVASQEIVNDSVVAFTTGGNTLAYETSDFEVFVGDLPGTSAESVGAVGDPMGTQGGFYLKPDGTQLVAWTVTLTSMTLFRFEVGVGGPFELYTFTANGFGGTGSFYGPREKMAWSPDGRYLAVASTALVDTNPCQSNDECVMPEVCGANARCTSQRLTINLVDIQNADKLGLSCTSNADCGEAHTCDFANPQDPESGQCQPSRLDLGAAGPSKCEARQDGDFTEVEQRMVWSPDSQNLFLLVAEDCSRFNIPRVAILKTDTELNTPTVVLENPGSDFSVANCYDAVDDVFTVGSKECVVNISEMALSPDGNTVIFGASSPAAQQNIELYTIDRNGSRDKRVLTDDLETKVEQIKAIGDL